MRAIDGDAFAEFLKDEVKRQKFEDTKIDGLLTVADVIEAVISELEGTSLDGFKNAPTIEPERKTGKWIVTSNFDECLYAKCNQCNVTQVFYYGKPLTKFCPNCGSYNGGKEDE